MTDQDLSKKDFERISTFFKFLKNWLTYLAGVVGLVGFYVILCKPVVLRTENPLIVVDAKKFGDSITGFLASGAVSSSVVQRLNASLTDDRTNQPVRLGELGGKIMYYREWKPMPADPQMPKFSQMKKDTPEEQKARWDTALLANHKKSLGYTDPEANETPMFTTARVDYPLEKLEATAFWLNIQLEMLFFDLSTFTNQSFSSSQIIYEHDPFYPVIESLDKGQKILLYSTLKQCTESYSWYALVNSGSSDAFNLRVTANVNSNSISANVLKYYGESIEEVSGDTVQLRISNLAPDNYKLIVIHSPIGNPDPVLPGKVRLDDKDLVARISDHPYIILILPIILAFGETYSEWRLRGITARS